MQKNYSLRMAESTSNPLKSTGAKRIQKNTLTTCLLILFTLLGFSEMFGQLSDCGDGAGGQLTVAANCSAPVTFNSNNNTDYWNSAAGCNASDNDDAWGWFDATSTSTTITYNSTNDAVLHLFTGGCATGMAALACADATVSGDETITYATTPGVRYRIRIQRYSSNMNMSGTICVYSVVPPTITSLGAASGCVGSSLVITGTNLTGATTVTIGGTAAAITGNTPTTVTVTVGTGTTGTVQVTTPGGSATSAATFTVNPLPAAIGGGAATVCIGTPSPAFTNATGGGTWSIVNGTGSATISGGGVVTGVTTGTATVVYTLPTTCSISTPITIATTPTITTNPANSSINVGTNTSFSVVANNSPNATGYVWQVSTNGGSTWTTVTNGGVYSNATTATLNITGATIGMNGYMYHASASNACGTSSYSTNATLLVTLAYCTPSSLITTRYIRDVFTTGNITNLSNLGTAYSGTGYANYTALPPVTQIPGGGVAVDYYLQLSRQNVKIWVDWNQDGTFTDAAPELVYQTGGTVTIAGAGGLVVPLATLPGDYRIRIRTRNEGEAAAYGPCGLLNSGETEDYTLRVVADCAAKPNALYDGERCDVGTVVLGVEGTPGVTEFRFYDSLFGGTLIGTAPAAVGVTNWTTPALATTTSYFVTAFNGVCESWYRQEIIATINPVANIIVTPSVPEVCGENNIVQITAGGDFIVDHLVNEDFEGGGFGILTNVNPAANVDTQWTNRTGPYVPTGSVWKPAITSKAIGNRFLVANSDFAAPSPKDTQIRTVALDATVYSDLFLNFRHYFSYYPGEPLQFADVDVSTDGGGAWTNVARYTSNQGYAGEFANTTIDLSAYAGLPSVMVRFRFHLQGSAFCDGWAIDDVKIYGTRPLNTTFTWTGGTVDAFIDPACTIPYVAQTVTTVYVRPTAMQLASPSWSFTANATLGNGCPISEFITITNKTKLWKGTIDNDWYNPNNWEPVGVPDANTCVFIYDGPFDSNINISANDAFANTVTVRPSGLLEIQPNNDLTVTNNVTVDAGGTFNIENSGSLIQVNNLANTGTISMKRNVSLRRLDYVYWSSPVANYGLNNISTTTYRYKWLPTIGTNTNGWGNWTVANETMVLGKGYIVRGPDSFTTTLQNYTQNFVGVPNNGIINMPISRGTYNGANYSTGVSTTLATRDDDNWNLIGNPYPSAINANTFLATNTNIAGFIKYWTHGTLPSSIISDPFYNNYGVNYTVADYVTYNATGANPAIGNGNIAAGQGFFVLMNHTSAATTENVVFNNTMRRNDYRNDLFYRNENEINLGENEKHRIWLNLISPSATSSTTLIGYIDGATNNLDRMFDAPALDVKTNFELYSFSNSDKLNIQGKALPFDSNDQIPLGIRISQNGIHTIGISTVDGLFGNNTQSIYLEDRTLGVTHDLRSMPYSFTGTIGSNENRFVLKFKNETLSNEDFTANAVTVFTNENINVIANNQTIKSVRIFDLLGRVLGNFNNVNATTFEAKNVAKTQSALLVEVTLDNGATKTYKVIF